MTRIKKFTAIGLISALSVSCVIPLAASAETAKKDDFSSASVIKTINEAESGNGIKDILKLFGSDLLNETEVDDKALSDLFGTDFSTSFDEDIDAIDFDDEDLQIDYGDLTEDEIKELEAIYNRYEEIFREILPEGEEDISDEEFDARLKKYEAEFETLGKREAELLEKAGLYEYFDEFEDLLKSGNYEELLEDADINEILKGTDLEGFFEGADIEGFVNDLVKDIDVDPEMGIEDLTSDKLIDITGSVINNLSADSLGKLLPNMETEELNEVIGEMKNIVSSDEFKQAADTIIKFAGYLSDEF